MNGSYYLFLLILYFLFHYFAVILVGHYLLAVNGQPVRGCVIEKDGTDIREFLNNQQNYPVSLKFGRSKPTINEKIMLASMFHS